jgi:hypothetical protein
MRVTWAFHVLTLSRAARPSASMSSGKAASALLKAKSGDSMAAKYSSSSVRKML